MNKAELAQRAELNSVLTFLHYAKVAFANTGADYDDRNTFNEAVMLAERIASEYRTKSRQTANNSNIEQSSTN